MANIDENTPQAAPGDSNDGKKITRKRSSIFERARKSFQMSKGNRGANVDTLRGNTGSDFESLVKVHRGSGSGEGIGCGCVGGNGDKSEKKNRLVLIKGTSLFVFADEKAASPKYAVALANVKPKIQDYQSYTTVYLETSLGDIEYRFTFDTNNHSDDAKLFASVVINCANMAQEEIVKKRLGHENLKPRRTSVAYADKIAAVKAKDQPEAPVNANEVLEAMPKDYLH